MHLNDVMQFFLFSCAVQLLCGCAETCGKEWYINDDGCAVGRVVIHDLDEFDEVKKVSCFLGTLQFEDFPPNDFGPALLANIREVKDFSVLVTDDAEIGRSASELNGRVILSKVSKLEAFSIFTNGVVSVDIPIVESVAQIVISENIDLQRASFGSLIEITEWLLAEKSPSLELDFPVLKSVGRPGSSGVNIGDLSEDVLLPELEQIGGPLKISASGIRTIDVSGNSHWSGASVDLPKLSSVSEWIDIGSLNMLSLKLPSLLVHEGTISLGGFYAQGALDSFGLEEAGAISISSWVTADGTTTFPHLRKAGSISMKSFDYAKVLYLPALEELGSLFLEECWKLRKVDFPALKCLGSVETLIYFPNSPFCLLPEELDDEIARSRANGCEPVVDVDDPRTNFYHPYDESWCLADGS